MFPGTSNPWQRTDCSATCTAGLSIVQIACNGTGFSDGWLCATRSMGLSYTTGQHQDSVPCTVSMDTAFVCLCGTYGILWRWILPGLHGSHWNPFQTRIEVMASACISAIWHTFSSGSDGPCLSIVVLYGPNLHEIAKSRKALCSPTRRVVCALWIGMYWHRCPDHQQGCNGTVTCPG